MTTSGRWRTLEAVADYRFLLCDVFTDHALAGNQLAVFPDARAIPEDQLLALAREIHFSEAVFAYAPSSGTAAHRRIRIFTPKTELPFAGHPVLGAAVALAGRGQLEMRLETGRDVIPVRLRWEGSAPFGWMSQPIPSVEAYDRPEALLRAVGADRSRLPIELYDNGVRHVFIALESPDAVARLEPDMAALARSFGDVGVNCFTGAGRHWKTRMFWPADGIAEDPATGSAAGPLGLHLARHGLVDFGERIEVSQGAEIRRPSTLYVRVDGSSERVQRIEVSGHALVVGRGEFDAAALAIRPDRPR